MTNTDRIDADPRRGRAAFATLAVAGGLGTTSLALAERPATRWLRTPGLVEIDSGADGDVDAVMEATR